MGFLNLIDLEEREIVPGFRARFVHSENMTLAYWEVDQDASLPEHSHPHEQMGYVISGQLAFDIGGNKKTCRAGDTYLIPGGISHSAKVSDDGPAKVLDIFSPPREEYK